MKKTKTFFSNRCPGSNAMFSPKLINTGSTILFVLLCACFSVLQAQVGGRQKVKVSSVTIEGITTADPNFIKLNSGLVEGEEISGEDIQKAIRNLWELNMFSDIDVIMEKEVANSIYLTVKVKEYPRLESIELQGNKKIKKKDLEKELNFYRGQMLSPQQIKRAEQRIKALYAEKGHLLAEVESRLLDGQVENKKILRLAISEGNKVKIEGISFEGNGAFPDKKLRKQLKDTEENGFLFFGGGDFDPEKYQEDLQKLVAFYRKEGFRDAEVVRDSIYYGPEKRDMFIKIWVDEGQRYYFGDITWEGNEIYPTKSTRRLRRESEVSITTPATFMP
jgi:outer membrane protein insertion porin family